MKGREKEIADQIAALRSIPQREEERERATELIDKLEEQMYKQLEKHNKLLRIAFGTAYGESCSHHSRRCLTLNFLHTGGASRLHIATNAATAAAEAKGTNNRELKTWRDGLEQDPRTGREMIWYLPGRLNSNDRNDRANICLPCKENKEIRRGRSVNTVLCQSRSQVRKSAGLTRR
jgi:hypothetical protein